MADPIQLPDEVRTFIVTQLACYETPSAIAKAVKEDFGLEVSRQRVHCYDPTKKAGKDLGAELKAIFEVTRAEYLDESAKIGIAQPMFRLRMMEKELERARGVGNGRMVMVILEQAAKETGGFFTNKRVLTGPDGKPIQTHNVNENKNETVTPEAAAAKVKDELDAIFSAAAHAGNAAANAPRSHSVLPAGTDGSSAAQSGASTPGEKVAGTQ